MKILAAAAAFFFCAQAGATTIVAFWTPQRIVIAGDSLIASTWTGENGAPQRKLSKDCKIRKFGANYISAAGNYHIQTAGFDLWATAQHACGTSGNVELCAARFKSELRSALARVVGIHDVHLAVLVAGLQNGQPALEHITFVGQPDGRLSVKSESFRRGKLRSGRVILGERDAIDRYERGAAAVTGDIEDQAVALVRIESRALPQEVGAPFSSLTIEPGGEHWVNPGCCPASCSK